MADPILDKIIADMAKAHATKRAAFEALSPDDLDAYVKEESNGKYGLKDIAGFTPGNITRSAVQGATMGWGDELGGMVKGEDWENRQRTLEYLYHKQHPYVDTGTKMITGALPFIMAPELEGASLAGQIARGAAIGAGTGALSAAGESNAEDLGGRLRSGAAGATIGGVLGGAIPAGIGAAKWAFDPEAAAVAKLANVMKKSGGIDAVKANAAKIAASGRGDQMMLGDLSQPLRGLTDFAANADQDTFNDLVPKLQGRQADQSERLLNDARTGLGGDPNADESMALLKKNKHDWASGPDGYGGLRDANPTFDISSLQQTLKKPGVAGAWKAARLSGDLNETHPINQLLQQILDQNPGLDAATAQKAIDSGLLGDAAASSSGSKVRPVSFDDLQQLRRALSGKAKAAQASGNVPLSESYNTIGDAVSQELEAGSPGYLAANSKYKALSDLERALENGGDAWDQVDSRGLSRYVKTLSPGERDQFRGGLASRMIAKLRSASTNRDEATKLVNASPSMKDKLRIIFGDQSTFDTFMQNAGVEADLHKLNSTIGGSATFRRFAASGIDPASLGIDIAKGAASGNLLPKIGSWIAQNTKDRLAQRTAAKLGPWMTTQGEGDIMSLLNNLPKFNPLLNRAAARGVPLLAGRGAGSLFEDQ